MEHRCRRGAYCSDYETDNDNQRIGRTIVRVDGLCETCTRQVERALVELPGDFAELNTVLGHGSTVGGEPVRMTRELPIPIRAHIEALQRDMVREVSAWAGSVAAVRQINWQRPGRVRPGWELDRACSLLANSTSVLFALRDAKHEVWSYGHRHVAARDGLDGALEVLRLHHRARAYLGKRRLVNRLPVPCPRCEAMALEREDGADTIDCSSCDRHYTWDEYEQLCLLLVGRREAAA